MAKYDLDDSHADPRARRSNRWALAGLVATFAIAVGAGYIQSHPWQTSASTATPFWYPDVRFQNRDWRAVGGGVHIADTDLRRVDFTDDHREVYERIGGGGGTGAGLLYVKLDNGYFLPIALK
jgi:hypothetical protein